MMSDSGSEDNTKPVDLDDIYVNFSSSPKAQKQNQNSYSDKFRKVKEEKEKSAERFKARPPLFPKEKEQTYRKPPLKGNPTVFG